MKPRILFLLLFVSVFCVFPLIGKAQVPVKDSVVFSPLINFSYAYQVPGGDLKQRFGSNSNVGFSFLIKDKKNFIYGIGTSFILGKTLVEEDILASFTTNEGFIYNEDGAAAEVRIFERGYTVFGYAGKLIPVLSPNKNSGIYILGGLGFMQHKIKFDDVNGNVPQLTKEYKKGYDRLTNGLATSEAIGYRYAGNSRVSNFYIELEFIQGYTQNRRSYNFDTMEKDTRKRLDLLMGIKFGWTFPAYKKTLKEYYFN